MSDISNEPLLDMYIFETEQLLEQLEQLMLNSEKADGFSKDTIDEVFRIMHTIKGSSAMMMFNAVSNLAHCVEDLFYILRNEEHEGNFSSYITDLVFEAIDFIKQEVERARSDDGVEGDPSDLINIIKEHINDLKFITSATVDTGNTSQSGDDPDVPKHAFKAVLHFEEDCEMENIRAYSVVHHLQDVASEISHIPEDLSADESSEVIKKDGFLIFFRSDLDHGQIQEVLLQTIFLKDLSLTELDAGEFIQSHEEKKPAENNSIEQSNPAKTTKAPNAKETQLSSSHQSILSVDVSKLDKLMDLVGEMVIAEAMVIQNPDLAGLELNSFQKAAQRLDKITKEIQDMVMSIRMVSLAATFQKMNRIVRDMCKKLEKEATLVIIGEETEVDKNIIEHISDPLMHLVRNALDHGIESAKERQAAGKDKCGTITLEAKSAGSDVLIVVRDDGRGLSRDKILMKAQEKGLIHKPESEMNDREVFNLILHPGFSTKDSVTEYSGRGVGMDVVAKNIEAIGGSVLVDSTPNAGTTITLKIPLTLAIVEGMNIKVGKSLFTLPTIAIRESFRPSPGGAFTDPEGNEMIMVRGECYPILRLHKYYRIPTDITEFTDGIIIMVEHDDKKLCIFADELLSQQQIVVKTLPKYIRNFKKINGLAGCTLLGDGNISLILDIGGLING
jgi:two-component system chemotaxis sensor kinase CheA